MQERLWSRRDWLGAVAAAPALGRAASRAAAGAGGARTFGVCLSPAVIEREPELVDILRAAGVGTVWLAGFFYGHRPYADAQIAAARRRVEAAGMAARLVNVPLGHPGDSLGARDGDFPLTPPAHWRPARRPDGTLFVGTSLHAPATAENAAALRALYGLGFRVCLLDDDFRLARGPGEIGGCFCDEHRARFLPACGYAEARWDELLDDVRGRRLTPLLRAWTAFMGDELTASFRAQGEAFADGELGVMVMYLGAEKAGIRLRDFARAPMRVGELMFDDASFAPVKGKTDELFSALFHRRFVSPENAYSETTAFPADRLSAANMAAKLAISTIADVRHTLFMSGVTPFSRAHWDVLGPAMRRQAALHELLAGHQPRGPFKHCWGEAQRMVGDDRPFSLWLAAGVPFEVVAEPGDDGWAFLSDFDARELAARPPAGRARLACRPSAAARPEAAEPVGESLEEIFAFRRGIMDELRGVPHIAEELPAVCAWYPTAGRVLVWNLSEQPAALTLVHGARRQPLRAGPLECVMAEAG